MEYIKVYFNILLFITERKLPKYLIFSSEIKKKKKRIQINLVLEIIRSENSWSLLVCLEGQCWSPVLCNVGWNSTGMCVSPCGLS